MLAVILAAVAAPVFAANVNSSWETTETQSIESDDQINNFSEEYDDYDDQRNNVSEEIEYQINNFSEEYDDYDDRHNNVSEEIEYQIIEIDDPGYAYSLTHFLQNYSTAKYINF